MPHKDVQKRRAHHREYMKLYLADPARYEAHKRRVAARNARLRLESSRYLSLLKSSTHCVVCGEATPCCLAFHHIDPANKEFDIACAGRLRPALDKLMSEVAKCVLMCHNCHSKLHAGLIKISSKRLSQLSLTKQLRLSKSQQKNQATPY